MKILYLVGAFPLISESFIVNQIVDMIDRKHNIKIFSTQAIPPPYHQSVIEHGLIEKTTFSYYLSHADSLKKTMKLMFSSTTLFFSLPRLYFHIKLVERKSFNSSVLFLIEFLQKQKFDVVHVHFGFNAVLVERLKNMGLLKGAKFVTTFHGCDMHDVNKGLYDKLFSAGDLFTVNSEYSKSKLIKLGCSPERIKTLPVGLDTFFFVKKQASVNQGVFYLLFIGRLIELKAPDLLVRICVELKRRAFSFKCVIIGDGELKEKLQSQIKELELEKEVLLLGRLTQQQIIQEMQHADVFVYPGIYDKTGRAETQGLVIQEAQSMGLPVIVSNVGGVPEGLVNGETGFVVEEKDIEGFVEKICRLYSDRDLCFNMGEKGREFVIKNYDSRVLGDRLEKLYLE